VARARNIKPGLFKNEVLGVADPLYTILFEGLWILADRAGRLEDRPLRIKAEVFPYRDVDADAMLNWLEQSGFIRRYIAAGKRYILILEFVKHQNPHKNEPESVIPAPDDFGTASEEIGTASEEIGSTRADSGFRIPDSLIPDSTPGAAAPKSKPSRKKPQTGLPDDFRPNDAGVEAARAAGVDLEAEVLSFRNWHQSKGSVMADWQAAWRPWVQKAVEFGRGGKAQSAADWWLPAGFPDRWTAENAGCKAGNSKQFRDGKKLTEAA
jgi:hypothetical protein